jgi:Asp-tRNA(Asn)/Glu-tRNA(Gln) amidotransferase A subunit family amidase
MAEELCYMNAVEQAAAIRDGELAPSELVSAVLARIDEVNPHINAFVTILADEAMKAARAAENSLTQGTERGPLHGVPIVVKDSTRTAGVRTTFGSKAFADFVPDQSSPIYERLSDAGAILIGKTTLPEMAFKGVTDSPLTGHTNNPWNPCVTAGGSSGGSAAAVAAGMGALATGTDGGGSIRGPASCCGVVGFKPSCGRVPIFTEDSVFETTTHVGPIARTVADVALLLGVMAGPDRRDPYSVGLADQDFLAELKGASIRGLKVAYSEDLGIGPVESTVRERFTDAVEVFERDLGVNVEEVSWKIPDPVPIMRQMWTPVACILRDELLRRESREDIDQSILDMAEEGEQISGAELYRAAMMERDVLYQALASSIADYDLLLTPTLPVVPFPHPPLGGQGPEHIEGQGIWPYSGWLFLTAVFNYTGHPALTVPCGFSDAGLPIGLQIIGQLHDDAGVLRAAATFEAATEWTHRRPPCQPKASRPDGSAPDSPI